MNTAIFLSLLAFVFILIGVIFYFLKVRSKKIVENNELSSMQEITSNDAMQKKQLYEPVHEIELKGNDSAGIVVRQYKDNFVKAGKKLDLDRSGINRSAPFLQQLPNALLANEALSGRYIEVIVNGDLASVKGASDVFHPIVRGENGKIIEQAKLKDPKSLQGMARFNMAFQLASVVVAQKHLADISQSLDELKADVAAISAFQKNERYSKISGKIEYLRQIESAIRSGELDFSVRSKFEDIELELIEIQDHLEMDVQELCEGIECLKDMDTFGTEDTFKALKQKQLNLQDILKAWSECVLTRSYACTLLSAFPGNRVLISSRVEAINSSVHTMKSEILPKCSTVTKDRLSKIGSIFNSSETISSRSKDVEKYLEANSLRFEGKSVLINRQLTKMYELYLDQINADGIRMVIAVNEGNIEEAFLLER